MLMGNLDNFLKQWILSLVISWLIMGTDGACRFPYHLQGDWFSMSQPWSSGFMVVDRHMWGGHLECDEMYTHNQPVAGTLGSNHTFLLTSQWSQNCTYCLDVLWRTSNVLQVRQGTCMTGQHTVQDCDGVRRLPDLDQVTTMLRVADERNVNCSATFDGVYQFTYEEVDGSGRICDSPDSQIRACEDPGSPYIDNELFRMQYARCDDVQTSYNKQIRYQCYGTWFAMRGGVEYKYAAISDTIELDPRERFRCLMTTTNQKDAQTKTHWVMSRNASCEALHDIRDAPIRLVLTKTQKTCPTPIDTIG